MTISELEKCILHLLRLAVSRGVIKIETDSRDNYWSVSSLEWVDMTRKPELVVGSIHDDIFELSKLLSDPCRASAVDFDRVAAVLRLLSDDLSLREDPPQGDVAE